MKQVHVNNVLHGGWMYNLMDGQGGQTDERKTGWANDYPLAYLPA